MSQLSQLRPAQAYEDYFVPAIFARWVPVLLGHADPRPGERVLDLACGTGIVARTVAPLVGPKGEVVALDPSPAMLEVGRSIPPPQGARIQWVEGEAGALPGREFDLVLCQQGLQFFPERGAAAREMKRVLAEDGRAVVSVWRGLEEQPIYEALCRAEARHLDVPLASVASPFMFGDEERLRALFLEAGFRDVQVHNEVRDVRFPSAAGFVSSTLLAASAVIPELAEMGSSEREGLIQAVKDEVEPLLSSHLDGSGAIRFPMSSNVAVASA